MYIFSQRRLWTDPTVSCCVNSYVRRIMSHAHCIDCSWLHLSTQNQKNHHIPTIGWQPSAYIELCFGTSIHRIKENTLHALDQNISQLRWHIYFVPRRTTVGPAPIVTIVTCIVTIKNTFVFFVNFTRRYKSNRSSLACHHLLAISMVSRWHKYWYWEFWNDSKITCKKDDCFLSQHWAVTLQR